MKTSHYYYAFPLLVAALLASQGSPNHLPDFKKIYNGLYESVSGFILSAIFMISSKAFEYILSQASTTKDSDVRAEFCTSSSKLEGLVNLILITSAFFVCAVIGAIIYYLYFGVRRSKLDDDVLESEFFSSEVDAPEPEQNFVKDEKKQVPS